LAIAQELLADGARKAYAAARNPEGITVDGVHPVRLDVTKPDTIAAAANEFIDINLLINNAGIRITEHVTGRDSQAATSHESPITSRP